MNNTAEIFTQYQKNRSRICDIKSRTLRGDTIINIDIEEQL